MKANAIAQSAPAEIKSKPLKIPGRRKKWTALLFGGGIVIIASICAAALGSVTISPWEVFSSVWEGLVRPGGVLSESLEYKIVWDIRLPRAVMAVVAGMGLAVSGVAIQSVLRNPLASPFTVGVSSAAGFGAAMAVVLEFGITSNPKTMVASNAFFFSLVAVLFMYALASSKKGGPTMMVLAGIAVMYLFSAMTTLLQYLGTESELAQVVYWLFGSLTSADWGRIAFVGGALVISLPIMMWFAWDLNVMAAGDDVAESLGIRTSRIRLICVTASAFLTAAIICMTGVIGFVCLVAPHMARLILGSDHRFLFPGAAIIGALVLLSADTLGRTVVSPLEIPVGIVTSFVGAPLFLYLLLSSKQDKG
ncbi:transport system permease protein [Desulfatibacillum aliphaticivorans]|uniref:Transport system permease protein n=1 Tax=Desulfatibacillum aliphaticivorans TaxID=218208 RepID=B8FC13_DESAL|nr:iron ABC transporter permease [Desulfatibacillum aliphaticivorans]ACL05218.1 transport system permease protein [Desulfatibacillum aliphaticivorans]